MHILIFSTAFVRNISNSKKDSARYYHTCTWRVHVKYQLFSSHFNEAWILSADFQKSLKY